MKTLAAPDDAVTRVSVGAGHASDEESTRQRVLAAILAASPVSATELAATLDLTAAAIRRHLECLEAAGKITTRPIRTRGARGRGRPAKAFIVTDSGRTDFHHEYDRLTLLAIDELIATSGPAGVDRLARKFFAPIVEGMATVEVAGATQGATQGTAQRATTSTTASGSVRSGSSAMPAHPTASVASSLVTVLNSCGYVASLTKLPGGSQMIQHHCPVADVARAYPQLCEIETQVFSHLLHSHVQRLATIAHGDPACTTSLPAPVSKTQHGGGRNRTAREVD